MQCDMNPVMGALNPELPVYCVEESQPTSSPWWFSGVETGRSECRASCLSVAPHAGCAVIACIVRSDLCLP
jgi:hypothetical protein